MAIDGMAKADLRKALTDRIVSEVDDPDEWARALRAVAERLDLNLARIAWMVPTLDGRAFAVIEEAAVQGRPAERIRAAIQEAL